MPSSPVRHFTITTLTLPEFKEVILVMSANGRDIKSGVTRLLEQAKEYQRVIPLALLLYIFLEQLPL